MAQCDVHRNTGRHADVIPYVVIVQSSRFDGFRRRVVVPLVRATANGKVALPSLNPSFRIRGAAVVLHPLEIVSVATDQLGAKVGSLVGQGPEIVAALDELLTRAGK
ncbi:MAG: CcdB family protein [Proteobacteria bacterium]|nr:CcdB family protein [Pseudomonadota bacterium]